MAGRRGASTQAPTPVVPQRIRKGSTVTLHSAHGPIDRKVIKIAGDVLVVSREEEVSAAKKVACEGSQAGGAAAVSQPEPRRRFVEVITTPRRSEEGPVSRVLASSDDCQPLAGIIFSALKRAGFEPDNGWITAPMPAVLAALQER